MTSDDGTAQSGRLEIFHDGGRGAICDRTPDGLDGFRIHSQTVQTALFTDSSVNVSCRQLGFQEGLRTRVTVRDSVNFTLLLDQSRNVP